MIIVTAVYTYNVDIPLDEWDAMSEDAKYGFLAGINTPDAAELEAEEIK